MWQQIFLGFLGLCSGLIIAGGVVGLMIGLSIVPRYAGITHTARHILTYEDSMLLGTIFGNLFFVFSWEFPLGAPFLCLFGIASGFFLGSWVMALAEMADIFPIFTRRIKFTEGLPKVIICVAVGKTIGSLLYYYHGWM